MSLGAEYRIELFNRFEALQKALDELKKAVCEQDATLPGWFQTPPLLNLSDTTSTREKASAFIHQLEYLACQKPKEILIGAGIFAASDLTLKAIGEVNDCKYRFKMAMLALKKAKVSFAHSELQDYFESALNKRPPSTTHALRKMGLAQLHLKQCYRLIPCLPRRPLKVSWTWAHTKAITRVTVKEVEALLQQKGPSDAVAYQLSKLHTLPEQEPLAIVRSLAPHLRTNIVLPEGQGTKRLMLKGTVPLFYPAEDLRLPELHPPFEKHERDEEAPIRSDVQLESKPFLSSLRVYRYLKNA